MIERGPALGTESRDLSDWIEVQYSKEMMSKGNALASSDRGHKEALADAERGKQSECAVVNVHEAHPSSHLNQRGKLSK